MSDNNEFGNISIAVVSNSLQHRNYLQRAMQCIGIKIVLSESLTRNFIKKMDNIDVDVVLLDIDDETHDCDVFEQLLDEVKVPVIFNDVSALTLNKPVSLKKWYGKLLSKIAELTGNDEWEMLDINKAFSASAHEISGQSRETLYTKKVIPANTGLAKNVWVLGSSLGGPEMLKQFLAELTSELPVAFVLAQHMGANFTVLLAEQLNRVTPFNVFAAKDGHVLRHQEVIVAPVNMRLLINPIGAVELRNIETPSCYSPSIDCLIEDMANHFGDRSGAIIFSGMGNDGSHGATKMVQVHGQVWAQDSKSCIVSSMPDSVREKKLVSLTGTPIELAKNLIKYYS